MGFEKFLEKAVDIFTGFSCERFQEISADFPQNNYFGAGPTQKLGRSVPQFLLLFDRADRRTNRQAKYVYRLNNYSFLFLGFMYLYIINLSAKCPPKHDNLATQSETYL